MWFGIWAVWFSIFWVRSGAWYSIGFCKGEAVKNRRYALYDGGHALGWMDFGFMIPRHAVMNTGWEALVSEATWHGEKGRQAMAYIYVE